MITAQKQDLLHKFHLFKLLTEVVDNPILSQNLYFKGGTCSAMAGFLDRFSVDLDFDLKDKADKSKVRSMFEKVFTELDFVIEKGNPNTLFFTLKYKAPKYQRNTLKISAYEEAIQANDYKPTYLAEIDRLVICQTIETMFANKLVAPLDRFKKHKEIAGRDIYDIHYFFSQGYEFKKEIIVERTKMKVEEYITVLVDFIEKEVTEKILTEDLNTLLPYDKFRKIRKTLKQEVVLFLRNL